MILAVKNLESKHHESIVRDANKTLQSFSSKNGSIRLKYTVSLLFPQNVEYLLGVLNLTLLLCTWFVSIWGYRNRKKLVVCTKISIRVDKQDSTVVVVSTRGPL